MLLQFVIVVFCLSVVNTFLFPIVYLDRLYNYVPPENEVTFYLYHRDNLGKQDQIIIENEESLLYSRFNPQLPTRVIIHGWTERKDVPWLVEMREDNYLFLAMARADLGNIIVVDWAPLSHFIYVEARVHNVVVAKQVKILLMFLKKCTDISMSSVHLIGHSMGAQIAAMASKKIKLEDNETIGRVTGLDPAAPLFEWPHIESLDDMLDPSDATFVDVIHTNGRRLGMILPAGHVDYYPNGGENQEGCATWRCSHGRSCRYWTASVRNPDLFKAYAYQALEQYLKGKTNHLQSFPMGIAANPSIPQGIYFVNTDEYLGNYST